MQTDIDHILKNTLSQILKQKTQHFEPSTPLLGAYAELDSMGIMTLLMELESEFVINMNDMDLSAEMFETYGSLHASFSALLAPKNVAPAFQ